ncbi:MAG: type II toxin-antitoxin system VapB family antitoxin [Bryobacter sp.]|nr:type II toxin-antitoxin system VapB family antitoxin [Bryobacter sp.]
MSLNIKNPQAHKLAAELAALTGESLTTTVILALENRLREEKEKRAPLSKAERIMAFARRFKAAAGEDFHSSDHTTMLYGEDGLPK